MIGLFAVTAAGRRAASELAARLGADAVLVDGPLEPALRRTWTSLDSAVFFVDIGSTVRLIAPLLRDEHTDPGVVCVDEQRSFAVAVAGGHSGGANALAQQVADVLDCAPVTTADSAGSTPLDDVVDLLDATVDGDLAACGAAILDGEPVRLVNPHGFALPAMPVNVRAELDEVEWTVVLDDRRSRMSPDERTVRLIPRTLVVGIGSARGVSRTAVTELLARLDTEYGLDPRAVRAFATVDAKADEHGILEAVQDMGFWHSVEGGDELELLTYPAEVLSEVRVPNPSKTVLAQVGTASVAEAAALHGARRLGAGDLDSGSQVELVAPKIKSDTATVAAARIRPRGRLALVALGPGPADLRTPRAEAELRRAGVVIGLGRHLDDVRHLLRAGTEVFPVQEGTESAVAEAIELAASGNAVALLGSGDATEQAHAISQHRHAHLDLVVVPGVPSL